MCVVQKPKDKHHMGALKLTSLRGSERTKRRNESTKKCSWEEKNKNLRNCLGDGNKHVTSLGKVKSLEVFGKKA